MVPYKKTITNLIRDNPDAKIVDEFACSNSVSFFVRFIEHLKKNPETNLKVRIQTITGQLEDIKRVISKLLEEQGKLDEIKMIATGAKNKIVNECM